MKNGTGKGMEVSRGERAVGFLMKLFNMILECEKMPEEWKKSELLSIHKKNVRCAEL